MQKRKTSETWVIFSSSVVSWLSAESCRCCSTSAGDMMVTWSAGSFPVLPCTVPYSQPVQEQNMTNCAQLMRHLLHMSRTDAGVWPSGLVRWLVRDFVRTVVGSNPATAKIVIVISCAPWQGCLNPVSHKVFLRCLPVYGGTTSAIVRWCNGASPPIRSCFARNISSTKWAIYKKPKESTLYITKIV